MGSGEEKREKDGKKFWELRSSVRVYVVGLVALGVGVGCAVVRMGRERTARAVVKSFEEGIVERWSQTDVCKVSAGSLSASILLLK